MIDISLDTKDLLKKLEALQGGKGVKYAVSMAITWTAKDAREAVMDNLALSLDRPKAQTIRSTRYSPASKDKTQYDVFIQDKGAGATPHKYLEALERGGKRKLKASERRLQAMGILPAGWSTVVGDNAPKDAYGNLQGGGGRYTSILSGLGAFTGKAAQQNRTDKSTKRRAKSMRNYFVLWKQGIAQGIFERRGSLLITWLKFVHRMGTYQKQLAFRPTIEGVWDRRFEINFREGLQRMLIKVSKW